MEIYPTACFGGFEQLIIEGDPLVKKVLGEREVFLDTVDASTRVSTDISIISPFSPSELRLWAEH